MKTLPLNPSESTKRRNPHLWQEWPFPPENDKSKPPKRLRQSSKPLMNKLEASFKTEYLDPWGHKNAIPQAIKFKLGNGIAYKPDWVDLSVLPVTAWEVKGPFAHRGGFENLKVAASLYRQMRWILVWKEANQWRQQEILP